MADLCWTLDFAVSSTIGAVHQPLLALQDESLLHQDGSFQRESASSLFRLACLQNLTLSLSLLRALSSQDQQSSRTLNFSRPFKRFASARPVSTASSISSDSSFGSIRDMLNDGSDSIVPVALGEPIDLPSPSPFSASARELGRGHKRESTNAMEYGRPENVRRYRHSRQEGTFLNHYRYKFFFSLSLHLFCALSSWFFPCCCLALFLLMVLAI